MTKSLALIVEDDEDLTVIFSKALEAAGYDTKVEMEGDKAWSRLETMSPALVVLDLHLPNLSGLDILHRLRTNPGFVNVIILAVSADARMAEMASAEADLVLIKPITFSQLRDLSSRFVPAQGLSNAEDKPAPEAPAQGVPSQETPAEETPAEEMPVQTVTDQEKPVQEMPAQEVTGEEAPSQEVIGQEIPAQAMPAQEVTGEDAPNQEVTGQEVPVQETPPTKPQKGKPRSEQADAQPDKG